jgi:prepilin signal peptidase PulO-like enzyme (type II secretory pathway)
MTSVPSINGLIPLVLAALVLLLPLLPPLRADIARLIRKAYPGSHLQRLLAGIGRPVATGAPRTSVIDAGAIVAITMAGVALTARPDHPPLTFSLGLVLLLLVMFDLRYRLLPDGLTLPLIALGVLGADAVGPGLAASVTGLLGAGGAVWLIAAAFRHLRGIDGLGGGDVKLIAAMGAWLGPLATAQAVAVAALSAIAVETAIQLVRHGRIEARHRIAFGAYLAGAFWVCWCAGPLMAT